MQLPVAAGIVYTESDETFYPPIYGDARFYKDPLPDEAALVEVLTAEGWRPCGRIAGDHCGEARLWSRERGGRPEYLASWAEWYGVFTLALLRYFARCAQGQWFPYMANVLSHPEEVALRSHMMRLPPWAWRTPAADLSDTDIFHLTRFLAVAEHTWPGWEAGPQSPVLPLWDLLRDRGFAFPGDFVTWVERHSKNPHLLRHLVSTAEFPAE